MNLEQLKVLVWVRWRIAINQLVHGGSVGAVLSSVLGVIVIALSISSLVLAFGLGLFLLAKVPASTLIVVWDVIMAAFLFFWIIGLVTELQRSETVSFEKLMHLPISLRSAFFLNYLCSWFNLSMVAFLPAMLGLALAQIVTHGMGMFVVLPLLASQLAMITAITYQLRGWIAALMENPRKRRTVIVTMGMIIMFLSQAPQLFNVYVMRKSRQSRQTSQQQLQQELERYERDMSDLRQELQEGQIEPAEFNRRAAEIEPPVPSPATTKPPSLDEQTIALLHAALPPGWLGLGVKTLAQHRYWPAMVTTFLAAGVAAVSLRRGYRSTIRYYRLGHMHTVRSGAKHSAPDPQVTNKHDASSFRKIHVPGIPDVVLDFTRIHLRHLLRAPEIRMALLVPPMVVGLSLIPAMFSTHDELSKMPVIYRPLLLMGAGVFSVLSILQLLMNQFGFDRDGFRTYMLVPLSRRNLLLAKNLSCLPIGFGISLVMVSVAQFMTRASVDGYLGTIVQCGSGFLVCCMFGNFISVLSPMPAATRTMRRSRVKLVNVLLHVVFAMTLPFVQIPIAVPYVVYWLWHFYGGTRWVPVYTLSSLVLLAALGAVYLWVLPMQGRLLLRRQGAVLRVVAASQD
ncbi:MAG: hypothetical protein R3E01_19890 [Pirellulaceae bacterium]|nr:hypothetical protein [Planctomycetales bacterium]